MLSRRALFAVALLSCTSPDTEVLPEGRGAVAPPAPTYGLDVRPANATCHAMPRPARAVPVAFRRVFDDVALELPTVAAQAPGDPTRWYVAQRGTTNGGVAEIVSFGAGDDATKTVVATVGPLGWTEDGEGGLLGMAFHPKFAQNGRLYVSWTTNAGGVNRSVIGYLTSTDGGASFGGYTEVLGFEQPASSHKAGTIAFGKDGYLYASFGDGGYPLDAYDHGQSRDTMFAKIVRIDVDDAPPGQTYGIPPTNPFAKGGGEPATFAYGFRNPFRFSIDRATGDVWVGDVGDERREEIDRITAADAGKNHGWPCFEGTLPYLQTPPKCPSTDGPFAAPVYEYAHNGEGRSITGGVVYRGRAIPSLNGAYVYGDFISQELFVMDADPATGTLRSRTINEGGPAGNWVSFAEDQDGEVYAVALMQGAIYEMVPTGEPGPAGSEGIARLSQTGCVDPADPTKPAPGLVPYDVNVQLWSDGADKERWLAVPDDAQIGVRPDGLLDLPIGSVVVKTFLVGGKRVETRLLERHDDGGWAGYSYEWTDDQRDAVLLPGGKTKSLGAGSRPPSWTFPSRTDCMRCHNEAAGGGPLGLELPQLARSFTYAMTGRTADQIATLASVGMLPRETPATTPLPDPFGDAPLEDRARAYLHVNCSMCHRPNGGGRSDADLRFSTPFAATHTCDVPGQAGDLGIPGAALIAPGHPERSLVVARAAAIDTFRMPLLGTSVVDVNGVTLLTAWIGAMTGCP